MTLTFAAPQEGSLPLYLIAKPDLEQALEPFSAAQKAWINASGFKAGLGAVLVVPSDAGISCALIGYGDAHARERKRFGAVAARKSLPEGVFHLVHDLDPKSLDEFALGWLLAGYRFERYKPAPKPKAQLIAPEGIDAKRLEIIANGEALTRDLINTPSNDMGPEELEKAVRAVAQTHNAKVNVTLGDALLDANFPLIHTVGRASTRAPRLIDLRWGDAGPTLTLVGKGVCFDTGGLNLKPGASMGLMKKDMGGAATVLGLAQMIMSLGLKLRLRVLIPAVENAVSGNAFRPGDVLYSRKGLSVENNNTDAEGRLVLADALALADEETPDLIVSMATLTGAARVAVGPDLAPFYARVGSDAEALRQGARRAADPVWEMPFHAPYEPMIEPAIADLYNAPSGGFAGSITAALFLNRFVTDTERYMHFDIYGWNPTTAPGRPKGGGGQGIRALNKALPGMLGI